MILNPVPDVSPDPDCSHCEGEGVPQSGAHQLLADEFSQHACKHCWKEEDDDQ